jgi:hypothetical protein
MSYLKNRKKIELVESSIYDLDGTLEEVISNLKQQHDSFYERIVGEYLCDIFVLIEGRYTYHSDTETPHLVAYRWETEGEYNLRVDEEIKRKEAKKAKELKLLAELKEKYGDEI